MNTLRIVPRHDGQHVRMVIDRPKANIVSAEVIAALRAALADIREDAGVKLVTIEGAGDHFSFGASVEEHLPANCARMLASLHALLLELLEFPAPVLVAVRGQCLARPLQMLTTRAV